MNISIINILNDVKTNPNKDIVNKNYIHYKTHFIFIDFKGTLIDAIKLVVFLNRTQALK